MSTSLIKIGAVAKQLGVTVQKMLTGLGHIKSIVEQSV